MLQTTIDIIKAGLRADPTIQPTERSRLLALLRSEPEKAKPENITTQPRIVTRPEAAKRTGKSLRTIDNLSKAGILKKVVFPGRVRAAGFLESDFNALILGNNGA